MAKLIVEVPDRLHINLKHQALTSGRTIKEIIIGLLSNFLAHPQKAGPAASSGTGFCGCWEDPRSAEEIIKDISSHRTWFKSRKG
ncbi:MAG: antitoxin [Elusimicrobia bacterium]|nr:antitoxin [Elusimicrobiota bacterium]